MSTITFAGNLTTDPELRHTQNGHTVARFTVIENRRRRTADGNGWEDDEPNAFRVQVWGQTAENVAASCHKGDRVHVTGRIDTDRWTDKDTGQERTGQRIAADEVSVSLRYHTVTARKNERTSTAPENEAAPDESWDANVPDGDTPF